MYKVDLPKKKKKNLCDNSFCLASRSNWLILWACHKFRLFWSKITQTVLMMIPQFRNNMQLLALSENFSSCQFMSGSFWSHLEAFCHVRKLLAIFRSLWPRQEAVGHVRKYLVTQGSFLSCQRPLIMSGSYWSHQEAFSHIRKPLVTSEAFDHVSKLFVTSGSL